MNRVSVIQCFPVVALMLPLVGTRAEDPPASRSAVPRVAAASALPKSKDDPTDEILKDVVVISAVVFEIPGKNIEPVVEAITDRFPSFQPTTPVSVFDKEEEQDVDALIHDMVEKQLVQVLSRPTLCTLDGVEASVGIGNAIKLPSNDSANLGLELKCTPRRRGSDAIELDLMLSHTALRPDGNPSAEIVAIEKDEFSTRLTFKTNSTVLVRAPSEKPLLLLLTAAAKGSQQGEARALEMIEKATAGLPVKLRDLKLDGDDYELDVELQEMAVLPKVLETLGKCSHELKTVRVSREPELRVKIHGRITARLEAAPSIAKQPPQPKLRVRPAPAPPLKRTGLSGDAPKNELQRALDELFPEEQIQVRQLKSAVILRGIVSERAERIIINVAEDYYPVVINDLTVGATSQAKPQKFVVPHGIRWVSPPAPQIQNPMLKELRQLRSDVKALREEVSKILAHLEEPESTSSGDWEDRPGEIQPVNQSSAPPRKAGQLQLEPQRWHLTEDEVVGIAITNLEQPADPEATHEISDAAAEVHAELLRLQTELDAADFAIRFASARPPNEQQALLKSRLRRQELDWRRQTSERTLRRIMGLADSDGRVIWAALRHPHTKSSPPSENPPAIVP